MDHKIGWRIRIRAETPKRQMDKKNLKDRCRQETIIKN